MSKIDQAFYENGTPKHVIPYNGEFIDGIAEYFHSNGRLRCRIAYNMGNVADGVVPVIDEDGEVFRIDVWKGGHCEVYTVDHKLLGKFSLFNGKAEGEEVWYHPNGVLKETAFCKGDKYEGHRKFYDENGHLYDDAVFVNDRLHGIRTLYYENGAVRETIPYKEDKAWGEAILYSPEGKLLRRRNFVDDLMEGAETAYYDDGSLRSRLNYQKGLLHGRCEFFFPNGNIRKVLECKAGKVVDGKVQIFNPDGSKNQEEVWENGVCKAYYENGVLRSEVPMFNGKFQGMMRAYYRNGQLARTCFADNDVNEGTELTYDEKGNLYCIVTLVHGRREGSCRYYDKNGMVREEEMFSNNLKNGPTRIYDEEGKLRRTIMYVDGVECGQKCFEYYGTGQLDSEIEIMNGLPNGEELSYHENGVLTSRIQYKDGMACDAETDIFDEDGNPFIHVFWKNNVARAYYEDGTLKFIAYNYRNCTNGIQVDYREDGSVENESYFYDGYACENEEEFLDLTFEGLARSSLLAFGPLGVILDLDAYTEFFRTMHERIVQQPEAKIVYEDYCEITDIDTTGKLTLEDQLRLISREFVLRLRLPNDGPTERNIIDSLGKLVKK